MGPGLKRVIVENIIPRNVIIYRGAAEVDNHITRDDIFDYHPLKECNIYYIQRLFSAFIFSVFLSNLTKKTSTHTLCF